MRIASSIVLILSTCVFLCTGCGPRMRVQASIKPYERAVPAMPANTVPTNGRLETFTNQQAEGPNPLPKTEANIENGRIYYGYYCVMCHGTRGDGNGPVGQSYVPKPTDLSSPAVAALSDSELYKGMLYGVGHSPVLDQTVLPEHRWPLVMYVRSFGE